MATYLLTKPNVLYDSVRLDELKKMGLFKVPMEFKLTLKVDQEYFPGLKGDKVGILCHDPGSVYVPIGNRLFIHGSHEKGYVKKVGLAHVKKVSAGSLGALVDYANSKGISLLFEENFDFGKVLPEDIGSLILLSKFDEKISNKDSMNLLKGIK